MNARKTLRRGLPALTCFAAVCWFLLFAGGLFDDALPAGLPGAACLNRIVNAHPGDDPEPPPPGSLTVNIIGSAAKIYMVDMEDDSETLLGVRVPGGTDDFPEIINRDPAANVQLRAYDYEGWTFMRWQWTYENNLVTQEGNNLLTVLVSGSQSRTAVYMRADVDVYDGHNGSMVSESQENTRCAFTVPNTNDTDGDGISDWDDTDVSGEKDLIRVIFRKPEPTSMADTMADESETGARTRIRIDLVGGPTVKLWKSSDKSQGEETRREIPIEGNELPLTLWLEGASASTALCDTSVSCIYELEEEEHDGPTTSDSAKATFVSMNLTANDLEGDVDEDDEQAPGAFIHYNIDNDNGNTVTGTVDGSPIADYTEGDIVAGENDLALASAAVSPASLTLGTVALKKNGGGIKVWKAATKGAANALLTTASEVTWDLSSAADRAYFNTVRTGLYVEG